MSFCICRSILVAPEMKPSLSKSAVSLSLSCRCAKNAASPRRYRTRRLMLAAWNQIETRCEFKTSGI